MKHTNKKGFTIVELVIVIAVIAILAAVLIPTFTNLIKKANQSSDIQAARQMNTVLAAEQGIGDNIDKVIDVLVENGYSATGLTPVTANHDFHYYVAYERVVLVDTKKGEVVFPKEIEYVPVDDVNVYNLAEGVKYIDVVANTAEDIVAAFNMGSEYIKLEADITLERDIDIEAGSNVTLDLNGHTYDTVQSGGKSGVIKVYEGASLTIVNGTLYVRSIQLEGGDLTVKEGVTINSRDITGGSCIRNKGNGTVTIEGGSFNVLNHTSIYEYDGGAPVVYNAGEGDIIIKGGTFTSATAAYLINNAGPGSITIENGSFTAFRGAISATNGKVVVNGGTFAVTNGEDSGWIAYAAGDASIELNGGEFSTVTENVFTGNVIDNRAN